MAGSVGDADGGGEKGGRGEGGGHDEDEREAAEPIWAGYASVPIEKDYYARRLFPQV